MKKSLKKTLALLLSVVMVMAMAVSVFATTNNLSGGETDVAAPTTVGGSITIENGTGTYKYYKIAGASIESGDKTYTYKVESEYESAFTEVFGDNWTWKMVASADAGNMKNLANKLESIAKIGDGGTQIMGGTVSITDNGYYLIIETGNDDALTCTQPILVAIPQVQGNAWVNNITVTPKASSVGMEKKIVSNDRTTPNDWLDTSAEAIGDTIDYVIKTSIPQYDSSVNDSDVKYTISDTPSTGLTVDASSIKVFKSNTDVTDVAVGTLETETSNYTKLDAGTDYSVTSSSGFSVDFSGSYGNIKDSKYIYVFFSAKLNSDASIATTSNPNEAKLTYSNDYTDATKTGELTDEVKSYTFKFNILKIAKDTEEDKTKLAGAKFELKKKDTADVIKLVKVDDVTYRMPTTDDAEASLVDEIISVDSGDVLIKGLDEGTYVLTETEAPSGYKIMEEPIEFTITGTKEGEEYTGNYTVTKNDDVMTGDLITVEDEKGLTLPGTGGIGTTIFTFGGLALVVLAAIMFIVYTRKQKKQA